MLSAIEAYLLAAVQPALPAGVPVVAGPPAGPAANAQERVEIFASALNTRRGDDNPLAVRGPALKTEIVRLDPDGVQLDFAVPEPQPGQPQGEIAEVEHPPGFLLRRGDDYLVDGRTVRLYRPPAAGSGAVVITVRGPRVPGYQERLPCAARVALAAWANSAARADTLVRAALAAALCASVAPPNLEAQGADPRVRARLLRPALTLDGMEREGPCAEASPLFRSAATLTVRADLELTVAAGAEEPAGIIREIIYQDRSD